MRTRFIISILLIICSVACVDRVFLDIGGDASFQSVVIDGHITNQPGPYRIEVFSGHDLEDRVERHPIRVKALVLSDDQGTSETLAEIADGKYETSPTGIRGIIGRVYTLRVELFDGRIYESTPDSLVNPGQLDSLYYIFNKSEKASTLGYDDYGFDIYFNSSAGAKNNFYFLWTFKGTFKAETHPEANHTQCFTYRGRCNFVPPCSGYVNVGGYTPNSAIYEQIEPCSCCTCWYNLFNDEPILSDEQLLRSGKFSDVKVYRVPLDEWIFLHKVYVEVSQKSLSHQSYKFWKAIKDQRSAINSLFQPVTGKIPSNFVQLAGPTKPIEGLFYAASISSKSFYITRDEIPNENMIPKIHDMHFKDDCTKLFPHSTATKPSYWED